MMHVYYYNYFESEELISLERLDSDYGTILKVISEFLFVQFHLYSKEEVKIIGELLDSKRPLRIKQEGDHFFSILVESKLILI